MNKIHSSVLALVLGIFLIQAADPPYEKTDDNSNKLLKFIPSTPAHNIISNNDEQNKNNVTAESDNLKNLYSTLQNIQQQQQQKHFEKNESSSSNNNRRIYENIESFLQKPDKSADEKVLENQFVRPLLTQYEQIIHDEPSAYEEVENSEGISKEQDYHVLESFQILSHENINLLLHDDDHNNNEHHLPLRNEENQQKSGPDTFKTNSAEDLSPPPSSKDGKYGTIKTNSENKINPIVPGIDILPLEGERRINGKILDVNKLFRRDDTSVEQTDSEHIGEILPPDFKFEEKKPKTNMLMNPNNHQILRKSFNYDDRLFYPFLNHPETQLRNIVAFPIERYRPSSSSDYETVAEPSSSDGFQYFNNNGEINNRARFNNEISALRYLRRPSRGNNNLLLSGNFHPSSAREPITSYFDSSARYQTASASSWNNNNNNNNGSPAPRRPRVIFPNDLIQFRDQSSSVNPTAPNSAPAEEPDWLTGDSSNLQILDNEIEDKGLVDNTCDGLLRGCCFRGVSKAEFSNQGPSVGTIEAPPEFPRGRDVALFDNNRCGISTKQQAQRRIVGGEEAGYGMFPWQAYIRIGSSRCGGSLISRRHVVTAGHCVARASPRQVHVTLGDYVINKAVEPFPAYTFGVSKIQVHPYFKFTPQADRFDVAVLRLDRPAHNLPHVTPICLPLKGENFLGDVGHAAGWGALKAGSRFRPATLQTVEVPVIDNRKCEQWHRSKGIQVTIYDEMMCAGYPTGGKDSCQGDSGGPLMLQKFGRWFLIGIVSAGYSCAQAGQPGIYHRVAHTVDWITKAVAT